MRNKPISTLPTYLRPREKLLSQGASNLTESELLAIVLGSGSRKLNALKLSEKIISTYSVSNLAELSPTQLQKIHGVGPTKAAKVLAAAELAQRIHSPSITPQITSTKLAASIFSEMIAHKKTEHIAILCLNTRNHVVAKEIVAMGTINAAQLQPRDIFSHALQSPSTALLMAHNHPSGNHSPSEDDYTCTKKIQEAGDLLGIPLLDHLIVSKTGYFSFREANLV